MPPRSPSIPRLLHECGKTHRNWNGGKPSHLGSVNSRGAREDAGREIYLVGSYSRASLERSPSATDREEGLLCLLTQEILTFLRSLTQMSDKMFRGKVIALTGGGQGIGLATARILASRGASLSLADSNSATLAEVEQEFKAKSWPVLVETVDVRSRENVDSWINTTVKKFGRLDGAANIAGTVGRQIFRAPVVDIDDNDWDLVLGVNVTGNSTRIIPGMTWLNPPSGTMNCLRAELKHLVDGGSIVNISSTHGSKGDAGCSAYVTSKHAVIGLTKCAAKEYGARGIRVNTVAPGGTKTPLMTSVVGDAPPPATSALKRYGEPAEIGQLIAWLLCPESSFITGELYRCDGGEFC